LFHDLKIWHTAQEIKEKQGRFPVINLSFKDANGLDWDKSFRQIVNEIFRLYVTPVFRTL